MKELASKELIYSNAFSLKFLFLFLLRNKRYKINLQVLNK